VSYLQYPIEDVVTYEILAFHGVSEGKRARLLDWSLQVLRVLNQSDYLTFFNIQKIIDCYLIARYQAGERLDADKLLLLGISATHISMKLSDNKSPPLKLLVDKSALIKYSL
jgi:hypothetical protein